ncbi:MAG: alpha/beta hydrolase [Thermoleophilia bacterium]
MIPVGFEDRRVPVDTEAGHIQAWIGGAGPPLLLLHGYPQTRWMWRPLLGELARSRTVVAADLRGYGESGRPTADPAAERYSKRAMAADMAALMDELGIDRCPVIGHDRGARVAHRFALDHPDRTSAVGVLDILPTRTLLRGTDLGFATAYWHWFFLAQGGGLPERMIGADPSGFADELLTRWSAYPDRIPAENREEYLRRFTVGAVAASCADYRAALGPDLEADDADVAAGNRVRMPLLALWGALGAMGRLYDIAESWRAVADDVTGVAVDAGHFVVEEAPGETFTAIEAFLARVGA